MQQERLLAATICLGLLLGTTSAQAASADTFRTTEYEKMGSLDYIHAAQAYAKGYTGQGVILGISDCEIRQDHPDFAGKTMLSPYDSVADYGDLPAYWKNFDNFHGTHVAGIMVAKKDDLGMHGVAFNAGLLAVDHEGLASYSYIKQNPQAKIMNCSVGSEIFLESQDLSQYGTFSKWQPIINDYILYIWNIRLRKIDTDDDYSQNCKTSLTAIREVNNGGPLYVFAAGNSGYLSPSIYSGIGVFYGVINKNNVLNVIACSPYSGKDSFNGPVYFSQMGMLCEDYSITAPGYHIYSTDATVLDATQPRMMSGTSMAAPTVSGVLGLVQEAYPYLTSQQLADVALTTAGSFPVDTTKATATYLKSSPSTISIFGTPYVGMNIICYDNRSKPADTDVAGWTALIKEATGWSDADFVKGCVKNHVMDDKGNFILDNLYFYNNVPQTVVFGQGVIDADKATNGLGALNAKRLSSTDLDTTYATGTGGKQALYTVNTAGYNGVFSNNISETRVLLPGTGADEDADLAARQAFYRQYAQRQASSNDPLRVNKPAEIEAYIAKYNAELAANPLLGLHVGLKKEGEGILRLTGNNTYQGATVVTAGTLAVDGSVAGDAYSTGLGTLAGTGTIKGNVYNRGILIPGTYTVNTVYDTDPEYQMGTLNIGGNLLSQGSLEIIAEGDQNSKLNVQGNADLTDTTLYMVDVTPNISMPLTNKKYTYLTAQGQIIGADFNQKVSPYVSLISGVDGKDAYFVTKQTQDLGTLPGMTRSEGSVGSALTRWKDKAVTADASSQLAQLLNDLPYMSEDAARKFSTQVTSESRAQLLNQSPLSSLTSETVYSRLDTADFSGDLSVNGAASLDAQAPQVKTTLPVTLDAENNLWFKLFRGVETYDGAGSSSDLNNSSFGGAVGYDHALNLTTRIGGLFSYGQTHYDTDNINGNSHDWRFGLYADHKRGDWDFQGLVSYGQNHYDIDRSVAWDSSTSNGDYKAKVVDAELKAKYLIPSTAARTWQVRPYGKVSYTHNNQEAYGETGDSIFKQSINSTSNNSWRGEIGAEFKRDFKNQTGYGGTIGYKRVFSGLNPELNGSFADGSNFIISTDNDRNFVTYSLNAHGKLGPKWVGQLEFSGEAGGHSHKEIYSAVVKYSF